MAEITNVSKLIINYLTEEQYQTAKASGLINENELYIESAQTLLGVTHPAVARFVIGTSTAGWTSADCDYLCDGTADQTEINTAITALPATGGEIVILDGTYNINTKINVTKDNVSIRGNGNVTILKRMFNSSTAEGVITLTGRSGCKIANLQIDGNKATYVAIYNYGIYLDSSSSDNTIAGNTCNNNSSRGIYLSSSSNNTITGNTCNSNNFGIHLYLSSSDNTVTSNTCNNNSLRGIYLDNSSNNTVTGNTCNNNTTAGISLVSSSSDNTVTGNTCNNNNYGIYLYLSSNNTVTGNTCDNNSYGIHLYLSSSDNTVTSNTCNNNSNRGIYLDNSSNNTVTGNTCNNNDYGIFLIDSSNSTITGNTCIRGTGLVTDYTASQHTIQLSGTNNNYNLISNNNCMGKAVTNGGGTGNTLVNNKFDDSDDIQAFAGTLANTDWTGSAAPYTKSVTVTGIVAAGKKPIIDVLLSDVWETAIIEGDEWVNIKRIVYTDNTLTFYADSIPSVTLNFTGVQVK